METFVKTDQVEVPAVCDVWPERMQQAKKVAINAREFTDHRKLLDQKNVDAVLIATPDHWHAATAIDALNAGKDVYVEKPLTLRIDEGPPIVKAARMNDRVCQVGMQQRSGKLYLQAKEEIVKAGKLGKVTLARTWWHGNGAHLMRVPEQYRTRPSNSTGAATWAR
jgi:predicted dehydrogenase